MAQGQTKIKHMIDLQAYIHITAKYRIQLKRQTSLCTYNGHLWPIGKHLVKQGQSNKEPRTLEAYFSTSFTCEMES